MNQTHTRRAFLKITGLALAGSLLATKAFAAATASMGKLIMPDEAWKKKLTPAQYDVLRREGTERPFSSPLLNEHGTGTFACVACDLPLFLSSTKFESGTGWPSFYQAIDGHIETKTDSSLLMTRTEYHCVRCGGHHGHVFNDGPQPTGLRYCNNGVALTFVAEKRA